MKHWDLPEDWEIEAALPEYVDGEGDATRLFLADGTDPSRAGASAHCAGASGKASLPFFAAAACVGEGAHGACADSALGDCIGTRARALSRTAPAHSRRCGDGRRECHARAARSR